MGTEQYDTYIRSEKWAAFRRRYFRSQMPKACLVCDTMTDVSLHHMTYERLGKERLTDVAPLCWICHKLLHEARVTIHTHWLERFKHQLIVVFKIARREAERRLKPWSDRNQQGRMGRRERRAYNSEKKRRKQDEANRRIHERMCGP